MHTSPQCICAQEHISSTLRFIFQDVSDRDFIPTHRVSFIVCLVDHVDMAADRMVVEDDNGRMVKDHILSKVDISNKRIVFQIRPDTHQYHKQRKIFVHLVNPAFYDSVYNGLHVFLENTL